MLRLPLVVALSLLMAPCAVKANDDYFMGALPGGSETEADWSVDENWSLGAPPAQADNAWLLHKDTLDHPVNLDISSSVASLSVGNSGGGTTSLLIASDVTLAASTEILGEGYDGRDAVGDSKAAVLQSAGQNSTTELTLGGYATLAGALAGPNAGKYTLSGGTLSVSDTLVLGDAGAGTFEQSGGTVVIHDLTMAGRQTSNASYSMTGGQLQAVYEDIAETGAATFEQSGGVNQISGELVLGVSFDRTDNMGGTYKLSGSQSKLIAANEEIAANVASVFIQTGGVNQVTNTLVVGAYNPGTYSLGGGMLQVGGTAYIGLTGNATLAVDGGDMKVGFESSNGTLAIASYSAATVSLNSQDSTISVLGDEYMGNGSRGLFLQNTGTNQVSGGFYVGNLGSSYALRGGALSASSERIATGTPGDGTGSFIQTGGVNSVASTLAVGPAGSYQFSGGSLSAETIGLDQGAQFTWSAGSLSVATLLVNGTMTLTPGHDKTLRIGSLAIANSVGKLGWPTTI